MLLCALGRNFTHSWNFCECNNSSYWAHCFLMIVPLIPTAALMCHCQQEPHLHQSCPSNHIEPLTHIAPVFMCTILVRQPLPPAATRPFGCRTEQSVGNYHFCQCHDHFCAQNKWIKRGLKTSSLQNQDILTKSQIKAWDGDAEQLGAQ